MPRYIDAKYLENQVKDALGKINPYLMGQMLRWIRNQPTIDAVEVVRCKDCKYWQDNNVGYPHDECRWGNGETPDPDDFCSYGERREFEPKSDAICGATNLPCIKCSPGGCSNRKEDADNEP